MIQRKVLVLIYVIIMLGPATGCVYHKPAFQGTILDNETKLPIEGAVVMAIYHKQTMGLGAGANTKDINVKEVMTDINGKFRISSYTTLLVPIVVRGESTTFIIFKPGYASLYGTNIEDYLSKKTGKEEELSMIFIPTAKIRLSPGIVGLPPLTSTEERLKAIPMGDLPMDFPCYKIKNLVRLIRQEYINLGYSNFEKWMEDCK